MPIKIISFDMDGTLITSNFDTTIWDKLIPQVYAKKTGMLQSESEQFFANEYLKEASELGISHEEWFKVDRWIEKYELDTTWEKLWKEAQNTISVFDDVNETLLELKKLGFKIIITTGASQEFIDVKLKDTNFKEMFDEIISVSSKYKIHEKGSEVYEKICEENNIKPIELLHIGDSYIQDFIAPTNIGCQALFLNRNKKMKSIKKITSLKEVIDYVKNQPEF